jgi:uncharacterized membrane protein
VNSQLPKWFFLLMVVYAAIHFSQIYPQLPAVVASHFDVHGAANGWQTKQAFFAVVAGVTVLAAFLVFAIPALIAIVPRQYVNLPNKDYWLAPERLATVHQFLSGWFAWFGCAVFGVIFIGCDYAAKWNLGIKTDPARLEYLLAIFGAFTLVWTIRLFMRFARVPDGSERQ